MAAGKVLRECVLHSQLTCRRVTVKCSWHTAETQWKHPGCFSAWETPWENQAKQMLLTDIRKEQSENMMGLCLVLATVANAAAAHAASVLVAVAHRQQSSPTGSPHATSCHCRCRRTAVKTDRRHSSCMPHCGHCPLLMML